MNINSEGKYIITKKKGLIYSEAPEEMANAIPGAQLYMAKDGGHVKHWEQLEKYNDLTLQFLLKHRG